MTSGGVFVHCTVEEGRLILDRILLVTLLEDLQIKDALISEDEPIIIYLDTSDDSDSPAKEEFLQLTTLGIGSENEIEDPTPFPLSIEEDCFDDDIGNSSKAPPCDLKGLKFEPAGHDLEEFMTSKENLLKLMAIISRVAQQLLRKTATISEFILIPKQSTIACKVFRSRQFAMIQEWD
jgi:hypothetical protein